VQVKGTGSPREGRSRKVRAALITLNFVRREVDNGTGSVACHGPEAPIHLLLPITFTDTRREPRMGEIPAALTATDSATVATYSEVTPLLHRQ
jgi:hypothetical protein